jgi:hypothetical protein
MEISWSANRPLGPTLKIYLGTLVCLTGIGLATHIWGLPALSIGLVYYGTLLIVKSWVNQPLRGKHYYV